MSDDDQRLIQGLREFASIQQSSFPAFPYLGYALSLAKSVPNLNDFYSYVLDNRDTFGNANAQLCQDIFVNFVLGPDFKGSFLEFGATDGVELSNTLLLEKQGWVGALAEPGRQWHDRLFVNRPSAKICTDCVYGASGVTVEFFESEVGVLSTISEFRESDSQGMTPGNTTVRNRSGVAYEVSTISLNDLVLNFCNGICPDYVSIDTEGSELEILKTFNFGLYKPLIFTVEHNKTRIEPKLDGLFDEHGYERVFRDQTHWDGWYVRRDIAKDRGFIK